MDFLVRFAEQFEISEGVGLGRFCNGSERELRENGMVERELLEFRMEFVLRFREFKLSSEDLEEFLSVFVTQLRTRGLMLWEFVAEFAKRSCEISKDSEKLGRLVARSGISVSGEFLRVFTTRLKIFGVEELGEFVVGVIKELNLVGDDLIVLLGQVLISEFIKGRLSGEELGEFLFEVMIRLGLGEKILGDTIIGILGQVSYVTELMLLKAAIRFLVELKQFGLEKEKLIEFVIDFGVASTRKIEEYSHRHVLRPLFPTKFLLDAVSVIKFEVEELGEEELGEFVVSAVRKFKMAGLSIAFLGRFAVEAAVELFRGGNLREFVIGIVKQLKLDIKELRMFVMGAAGILFHESRDDEGFGRFMSECGINT